MLQDHSSYYHAAAQKIADSETFSNSKVYQQLLVYLVRGTLAGDTPKETTIAMEVFGKDENFNPAESTLVRVNIYNLRKKLEEYYLTEGKNDPIRIRIPKGNYKVEFTEREKASFFSWRRWFSPQAGVGLLVLLLVALVGNYFLWQQKETVIKNYQPIGPEHALWRNILFSNKPVLIVLGDLFVFQEYSEALGKNRVIRDVTINSTEDLAEFFTEYPAFEPDISSTNYTHLIKNNAFSLQHIIPVLVGAQKEFDIQVMSRLTSEDLRKNNIIFIGLFKTLGLFGHYFEASPFVYTEEPNQQLLLKDENGQITETYIQTGSPDAYHTDYGWVAKFPGPHDNHILLFAGFQDTGVLQSVKNMTNPAWQQTIENRLRTQDDSIPACFEILFRAQGIDRTEFNTEIVYLSPLPHDLNIWQRERPE